MASQHQYLEIETALRVFHAPGDVFEVRLLHGGRNRIDSGYFTDPSHAATAIAALSEPYQGIYFTPNPVVPDLAARAYNRINAWAKLTTLDPDIVERHWLLIDVDPRRASGISSTDAELEASFKVAHRIANTLELYGWPRPVISASGNGAHLDYRICEPNNEFVRDEIAKFLKCLAAVFDGDKVQVDTVNFNAARIWRVPGTWARKGDNIPDRPHRKAYLVDVPENQRLVTIGDIAKYNALNEHRLVQDKAGAQGAASKNKVEYPEDERKYKGLNQQAMNRLSEWVPQYFPAARQYKGGYRVSSADLGLSHEEDLTIHPWPLGIKYFGVSDQGDATEGRRTPIALLAELLYLGSKDIAARKLADTLKAPLTEFDTLPLLSNTGLASPLKADNLPGTQATKRAFDFSRVPNVQGLSERNFEEQTWIINNVLPTGNIMLAARPKMRKTFLALQLCMAVCEGGQFLGYQVNKGEALLLGLEDNERRIKDRVRLLNTFRMTPPDLSGFRYFTGGVDISPQGKEFISHPEEAARTENAFPRGEAGVEALDQYLDMYPNTKVVVIDTLAHFREQSNNRDVYQRDVDSMMPLTRLAARRKILVLTVHHEKKGLANGDTGDFMEDVSGTSGITGSVDGVMSIKGRRGIQEENESRKLMLSGRDVPRDLEIDMAFDAQRGGWLPAARQDAATAVLALLESYPLINQQEFASLLPNVSRGRISQVLTQLKYDGKVQQGKYGYSLTKTVN